MRHFGPYPFLLGWLWVVGSVAGAEPWTLERALNEAFSHNPDARLARNRIAVAQAGLAQANAAFWPHVQFQSSYTRTDNPMMAFGSILNQRAYPYPPSSPLNFNDVPDMDDLNTRGMVTMPLYVGGRNKAGREAAKASAEAARQDDEAVRNTLGFEVARAFHTVLKTREFIRAAEAAVNSFQTNVSIANKRLEGGTLLKTDVLDLEVRLAQAREDLVRARNANALALRALRNLLGIEEGDFEVAISAPSAPAPDSGDFSRRAELAAARQRERAAEEQARGAKSGYLPRVSAFGSLDYDYGWKFENGGGSYTAGGLLQWDIWDGNLTRAKVREARANLDSTREEQRKVRLALDLEFEQARLEFKAANERLLVTQQAVSQAAESATLTRARFEQGAALATQLMDAETALVAARVRRADAEADQRIALAALRKAVGLPQMESKSRAETK
jgi:outer membrane protein TolC